MVPPGAFVVGVFCVFAGGAAWVVVPFAVVLVFAGGAFGVVVVVFGGAAFVVVVFLVDEAGAEHNNEYPDGSLFE